MYRDVKGIEFGAGTNQIQRLIIIRELMRGVNKPIS
jgi:alkylation response protein AidB-like acyl-CoA dehydrogenase